MQVILTGLAHDASELHIEEELTRFFHVKQVRLERENGASEPWALIEVADSYERVWQVCQQLRGVFHRGKRIHLYIPLHQEDIYHDLESHLHIRIP